ncbi:MAG: hypothetical protein HWD61_14500 [Parachlamydiaceae bacterium]|nr:MAG: hypothetical protein HWD61_14500 [Parachlamydiaceae bacterium]
MAALEQQNQQGEDQYKQLYANLEKESLEKQTKLQKIHQQLKKNITLKNKKRRS